MQHDPTKPSQRDPTRLAASPRCQARTKSGKSCRSPAVKGKRVCRSHGGAPGSGGPLGERNGAYRHGNHTKDALALKRQASRLLKALRKFGR